MKPFNMKLSDEDREKLERHRIRMGLRSHAEVVRYWINSPVALSEHPATASGLDLDVIAAKVGVEPRRGVEPDAEFRERVQLGPATPAPGSRLKKR